MYSTVYVPVDNSDYSNAAVELALTLGKKQGAKLVGSHVYAAKLHDVRFKQMEFTLPDEYREEQELEKQRKIHDALIARGLHLISDSYLDVMDKRCAASGLSFERKHFDGKNFVAIVEDINTSAYDLVVMGALGQGAVKDSQVGSVCERVLRRTNTDTLIIRNLKAAELAPTAPVAVAIDGSMNGYGALEAACALAKLEERPLEIIAVAGTGEDDVLAAHLEVAASRAQTLGVKAATRLLAGDSLSALNDYAAERSPWLLVVGKLGIDADPQVEVGSTTEGLVRTAPCNVLVSSRTFAPAQA
jgi:nucleotide-binding universal stress UspA family protein